MKVNTKAMKYCNWQSERRPSLNGQNWICLPMAEGSDVLQA